MDGFQKLLDQIARVIEKIAGAILAIVTVLVVASAVGRYAFSYPLPDAFDLSRYLLGMAITWGFASVGYRGSHIKVDLLAEILAPKYRRIVDCIAWSILLGFTILLTWKMYDRVISAARSGEATMDLRLPAWPFMTLILAGLVVSVIAILARLLIVSTGRGTLDNFDSIEAIVQAEDR